MHLILVAKETRQTVRQELEQWVTRRRRKWRQIPVFTKASRTQESSKDSFTTICKENVSEAHPFHSHRKHTWCWNKVKISHWEKKDGWESNCRKKTRKPLKGKDDINSNINSSYDLFLFLSSHESFTLFSSLSLVHLSQEEKERKEKRAKLATSTWEEEGPGSSQIQSLLY